MVRYTLTDGRCYRWNNNSERWRESGCGEVCLPSDGLCYFTSAGPLRSYSLIAVPVLDGSDCPSSISSGAMYTVHNR